MYGYVRSRQLEGTFPGDPTTGTWMITAMRVLRGWGAPLESDWPYDGNADHWPPPEPEGMDLLAKSRRIFAYQRVRNINDACRLLASGTAVTIALEISNEWHTTKDGDILNISDPRIGSHAVALIDYSIPEQIFKFRNSWGESWGDAGDGKFSFEYFEKHIIESWTDAMPEIICTTSREPGVTCATWGNESILGHKLHGIEFFNDRGESNIAWSFLVENENFLDIEELFVRPEYRNQKFGSKMINEINLLSIKLNIPLRLIVSYCDEPKLRSDKYKSILNKLNLKLYRSNIRWAPYFAV